MGDLDVDVVDRLLTTTRSVRKRLDLTRPVPLEVVQDCLRLATHAPTGSNSQGWRWVVVTDAAKRAALAELYRRGMSTNYAAGEVPEGQRRTMESARYLAEHMHEVPVLVVPCVAKGNVGAAGWAPSIYPAVWSFMLALRSRGLGSVLTTVHLYHRDDAAELLGIPGDFVQSCMIPVAYYTGDGFGPAARRPVEEVTYLDHWGHTPGA
jgi:nitroreductase